MRYLKAVNTSMHDYKYTTVVQTLVIHSNSVNRSRQTNSLLKESNR